MSGILVVLYRVHTNGGVQQLTLLRKGFLEGFSRLLSRRLYDLQGFLEGVLQWAFMGRRVLRRGSKKGLSRRHLEGRSTPFREYDPLGVCPSMSFERFRQGFSWGNFWALFQEKASAEIRGEFFRTISR